MRPTSCETRGRPPRAEARKAARSRASSASETSIATWTSAMAACRSGSAPPPVPVRSSQAVSAVPATTSGRSSSARRKDFVVVPPRITTVVSRSATRSRASASGRSRPQAMILATIES